MFEQAGIMIQYWKDLESSIMIWYFLDPVVMVRYLGVRSGGFCCEDFVF